MNKPFAGSCEQNKAVILESIAAYLRPGIEVLEVASGTGQHAVHFASLHPQVLWQTSDLAENLEGINAWVREANLPNLPAPIELDVRNQWPSKKYDIIFSANAIHIMNEETVAQCIADCTQCMTADAHLIVYGPFNYAGKYTSISNQQFDGWLKARDPESGIKHFEWVDRLAAAAGMKLVDDIAMPANNRALIWRHETSRCY